MAEMPQMKIPREDVGTPKPRKVKRKISSCWWRWVSPCLPRTRPARHPGRVVRARLARCTPQHILVGVICAPQAPACRNNYALQARVTFANHTQTFLWHHFGKKSFLVEERERGRQPQHRPDRLTSFLFCSLHSSPLSLLTTLCSS